MSELRERRYLDESGAPVIELPAGDVTEGVVRIGDTVRRPHQPQSYAVAAYLDHLEAVGFDGSPRYLGRDAEGRDVLSFIDGDVAGDQLEPWAREDGLLESLGHFVRRLHEASAGYVPDAEPFPELLGGSGEFELVSHLDVTPQNVVVRDGKVFAVVDFDLAGPATRLLDSYNTIMHWAPLRDPADIADWWGDIDVLQRLRVFADAYGWSRDDRMRIARFGAERAEVSWARMKHNAETLGGGWARMWSEGVGDMIRRRAEWTLANEARIVDALL